MGSRKGPTAGSKGDCNSKPDGMTSRRVQASDRIAPVDGGVIARMDISGVGEVGRARSGNGFARWREFDKVRRVIQQGEMVVGGIEGLT